MTTYPFYIHILFSVLRPLLAPLRFPSVTASLTMCPFFRAFVKPYTTPSTHVPCGPYKYSPSGRLLANSPFFRLISSYGFKQCTLRHAVTLLLGQGGVRRCSWLRNRWVLDPWTRCHSIQTSQPSGSCGGRSRGRAGRSRQISVFRAAIGMERNSLTRKSLEGVWRGLVSV